MASDVEVVSASPDDKDVLANLLELYLHDFSEMTDADVDAHGRFGYRFLDNYWTDPDRHPFVFRAGGRLAGLALVRSGTPHDMAEFFVLRKYRRRGVGFVAARAVFAVFPGEWQVREMAANRGAIAFWREAIPVPFVEEAGETGPVQRFRIEPAGRRL
jgi:predicted acetyltransferase